MPHFTGSIGSNWDQYWNPVTGTDGSWMAWNTAPAELAQGQWKSWRILVPETRDYTFTATVTGGGTARLSVDDSRILDTGSRWKRATGQRHAHRQSARGRRHVGRENCG